MTTQTELAALVARLVPDDGIHATAVPRLTLLKTSHPNEPLHVLHEPAVCIIVQGAKRVLAGDEVLVYGSSHFLTVAVDVPVTGQVIEASPEQPYLCLRLDLAPALLSEVVQEARLALAPVMRTPQALSLHEVTASLLDAMLRLVKLLETPADIPMLAPLTEREVLYRLLRSEQAGHLMAIAQGESRLAQVTRAIGWIKTNFRAPFRIEAVAEAAGMSHSALHEHFRAVTHMSPLQYQKQLRLQEARQLIFAEGLDAANAGHQVGYDSPSQFSREYARLFGAPPMRDMKRLREMPAAVA